MPVRNKILIVLGGFLVLLMMFLFVVYPLFQNQEPAQDQQITTPEVIPPSSLTPEPPDQPEPVQDTSATPTVVEPLTNEQMTMDEASQRAEVERLARLFVERFGSYSNFSDFSNITGMEQFMTASMKNYANTIVNEAEANFTTEYLGVTTRILSLRLDTFNEQQSATVVITVQEERQQGLDADIERTLRDGTVNFLYQNGEWLVDGLFYR